MLYLLREGDGPPLMVHSRCEDELLAKAELLLLAEEAAASFPGRSVVGLCSVDPLMPVAQFKRAYRYDHKGYRRVLEHRRWILQEGWHYPRWSPPAS